ncbi:UNVERIFIED_ORG: hypothetical protein OKW14_001503 [Pantoea brenneri]|nr:hypothetical protein [Pantoea brenneri]
MECPHCKKELSYPEYAWSNAYQYKKSCTVATDCCGKAISVTPRFTVDVQKSDATGTDDWGSPITE